MAYTEADTRAKLIDPQIKVSDWLESNIVREYYFTDGRRHDKDVIKEMGSDKLSRLIKLSGINMRELKEAFSLDSVDTREGYFGLQREIYK